MSIADEKGSKASDDGSTADSAATVQRLMDQYAEIARLAGGLAHEIRNPLSTIRLNMELLAEDLDEPQTPGQRRALKRVEVVRKECQRLQELLDGFLDYAKVRRLRELHPAVEVKLLYQRDYLALLGKYGFSRSSSPAA